VDDRAAVTFRAGVPADADAIAQVHVASWQVAYRGIVPDEHLDGLDWRERAAVRRGQLERAAEERIRVDVAIDGGSVVGFVASGPERVADPSEPEGYEVYALYVDPVAWDRGIGRDLLGRAVADAPADTAVVLWVLEDNARGRAFYQRQGFRADGARTSTMRAGKELPELRYRLDQGAQVAKPSDR
jgi:ribosomal protein S18 acetylase RimI-like enzyme